MSVRIWLAMGVGIAWSLGSYGQAQALDRPFLRVLDAVNWQQIEEANLRAYSAEGIVLSQGKSDRSGRWIPSVAWNQVEYIQAEHSDYEPVSIATADLIRQGYQLFFEVRRFDLEEVVFTANKYQENKEDIPFQIDVIKSGDIQLRNPATSATLLEQNGSVFVQRSQMGGGSPNLRGFEANKVLLVIDGVRMNNAIYRGGHLQNVITLDPNMIDRTEVLFGPGSVMYGSDALGGVMHFYSRDPALGLTDSVEVLTNVMARYASANHEKTLHADVNLGFRRWASLTSVSVSDFDDLRTGANRRSAWPDFGKRFFYAGQTADGRDTMLRNDNENIQRFSGYRQYDFMQKILFVPNSRMSHTLNIQLSTSTEVPRYDRLSQLENGQLTHAEWYYGPQDRLMATYAWKQFKPTRLYNRLAIIGAYQKIQESRFSRRFDALALNSRTEDLQVYSLNLDANKVAGKHEIAYGLEGVWNRVNSSAYALNRISGIRAPLDTRYPDGGSDMQFLAAYITDRMEVSPRWVFTAGLRMSSVRLEAVFEDKSFFDFLPDRISQQAMAPSGNIGLVYKVREGLRLSWLAATGFRAPNVDDLGKTFDSTPGTVIIPNADARPEYTYNTEISVSQRLSKRAQVSLTGFYTHYDDALVVRDARVDGADSILYEGILSRVQTITNAGKAYIVGMNLQASARLGTRWQLSQTLTYIRGQDLSNDVPMDHIPPLFGRVSLTYQTRRVEGEAFIAFNGRKRLERYSPSGEDNLIYATEDGMPGWWTANLRSSWVINSRFSLQLNLENILDQHYRVFASGISAPGRNLILSLRARF